MISTTQVKIGIPNVHERWGERGYKEIGGVEIEEMYERSLGVYIPIGFDHVDGHEDWGSMEIIVDAEKEEVRILTHGTKVSVEQEVEEG